MFSTFAWSAQSKLYFALKALRLLPPFHWNPVKKQFALHENPNHFSWLVSLFNVIIICCGIPIYAALTQIYGSTRVIPVDQVIFVVFEFFIGIHGIGLFISAYFHLDSLCQTLNEVMVLGRYLKGENFV